MKGAKTWLQKIGALTGCTLSLFSILLTVVCINVQAQPGSSVRNFNTDNGLPQNSVIDMTMGYGGYLWMGTQRNLVRYDGNQFRAFPFGNNQPGKPNGIRYIINTHADSQTIIGAGDGKNYTIQKGKPVLQDSWVPTPYADIIHGYFISVSAYTRFNKKFQNHRAAYDWGSNTVFVNTVSENDFIAAYENTPVIFCYKNGVYQNSISIPGRVQSLLMIDGLCFIEDEQSNLYLFDEKTTSVRKLVVDWMALKAKPAQYRDLAYFADQYNRRTWAFFNGTCYGVHLDAAKNKVQFEPQFTIKDKGHFWRGIIYDSSYSAFFMSTLTEGLFQVRPQVIQTIAVNDYLPKGLDPAFIIPYTVLKTSDTTALMTTGLQLGLTNSGITVKKAGNLFANRESLARLPDGRVLAAFNKEIYTYSPTDGFREKKTFNPLFRHLNSTQVGFLFPEGDSVWASSNDGIYTLTPATAHLIYRKEPADTQNYAIIKLFYRINGKEVFISNPYTSFILSTVPPYTIRQIPQLENKQVRYISRYKDMLLLSVHHEGLYIWKDGRFFPVPVNAGQEDISSCHSTYIDSRGYLWVTTNKGLYKSTIGSVVQAALAKSNPPFFIYYGKNDGIANTEFNGAGNPSYAVLRNEQLLYPSMGGIVSFRPSDISEKIPNYPVSVEKVIIDSTTAELTSDTIVLSPGFKLLVLELSAPFYGDAQNLVLEYSLDSVGWKRIPAGQRQIMLSAIPAGTHRLLVRKRTGFDDSGYIYAAPLIIQRKKSIYQQLWFYALLLLGVLLLYFLIIKIQLRSAERKRVLLQQKVDEQTQELSRSVEIKDLLISIIMHDMITPLRHITLISGILKKGLEKDPEKATQALGDIQTTSERIMANSNSIINWIKYSNKHIRVKKQRAGLRELVDEVMELYLPIAANKNISLVNDVPGSKQIETDPTIFNTILVNVIANAVKNTETGGVRVSLASPVENGRTVLQINDTGPGMRKETYWLVKEILKGNLQALKATTKINTGLGYIIIAELMKLDAIEVQVESIEEKGTTVTVMIN